MILNKTTQLLYQYSFTNTQIILYIYTQLVLLYKMPRIRIGQPEFDCIPTCRQISWTLEEMVSCSYCPQHFHARCIGITKDRAAAIDWGCQYCEPPSQTSNTLNTPHPLSSSQTNSSQETESTANASLLEQHIANMDTDKAESPRETIRSAYDTLNSLVDCLSSPTGPSNEENDPNAIRAMERISETIAHITGPNNSPTPGPSTSAGFAILNEQSNTNVQNNHNASSQETTTSEESTTSEEDTTSENKTTSQSSQSTVVSQADSREYLVERILDHGKADDGTMLYKVRWQGYGPSDDTWEPEIQFVKLYDRLAVYKRKHKLGLPTFKKTYGYLNDKPTNPANWSTADKIISTAINFLPKEDRNKISVKLLTSRQKPANHDSVYLLESDNHVYVGLHYAKRKLIYIADGENSYPRDERVAKQFEKWFKNIDIKAVAFHHQSKVDHCASTAAILINKFIELYIGGQNIPENLSVSKERHNYIKKLLHPEKSESIASWKPINQRPAYRCSFPGCSYKTIKRDCRVIKRHEMTHRRK